MDSPASRFSPSAAGDPTVWNLPGSTLYWGKRTAQAFAATPQLEGLDPLQCLYRFLRARVDFQSKPILRRFGFPIQFKDNWFRLAWLPRTTKYGDDYPAGWERAWHGSKMESLYSIAVHGILFQVRTLQEEKGFVWQCAGGVSA